MAAVANKSMDQLNKLLVDDLPPSVQPFGDDDDAG